MTSMPCVVEYLEHAAIAVAAIAVVALVHS